MLFVGEVPDEAEGTFPAGKPSALFSAGMDVEDQGANEEHRRKVARAMRTRRKRKGWSEIFSPTVVDPALEGRGFPQLAPSLSTSMRFAPRARAGRRSTAPTTSTAPWKSGTTAAARRPTSSSRGRSVAGCCATSRAAGSPSRSPTRSRATQRAGSRGGSRCGDPSGPPQQVDLEERKIEIDFPLDDAAALVCACLARDGAPERLAPAVQIAAAFCRHSR